MDRLSLERLLDQGLSLAEIGRRFDRHESTVAYWVQKYGLHANGRERHSARGGLRRDELASLVERGMSIAQIAGTVARSKATVRHWLREYALSTVWAERRRGSRSGRKEMTLSCPDHGMTVFRLRRDGGYRCAKCGAEAVSRRRRKVKQLLVEEAGGACALCGYNDCLAALEFHHVEPGDKSFSLSHRGVTRSLSRARDEAAKCILLCSNCHAEVEARHVALPAAVADL
jgi:transposase/DNA-directed RNA polymerase subunit RPC12/RpoP